MVTAVTFPVAFLPFLASTGYCGILWDLGCPSGCRLAKDCHGLPWPFFLISPGFWSGRKLAFKSPGPQNGPCCRWRWVEIWVSKDHFSVEKNVFCFVKLSYPEAKQKLANSFQMRKTLTRIRMYGGCRYQKGLKHGLSIYIYKYKKPMSLKTHVVWWFLLKLSNIQKSSSVFCHFDPKPAPPDLPSRRMPRSLGSQWDKSSKESLPDHGDPFWWWGTGLRFRLGFHFDSAVICLNVIFWYVSTLDSLNMFPIHIIFWGVGYIYDQYPHYIRIH